MSRWGANSARMHHGNLFKLCDNSQLQWNSQMRTLLGPRKSVPIREASRFQGWNEHAFLLHQDKTKCPDSTRCPDLRVSTFRGSSVQPNALQGQLNTAVGVNSFLNASWEQPQSVSPGTVLNVELCIKSPTIPPHTLWEELVEANDYPGISGTA